MHIKEYFTSIFCMLVLLSAYKVSHKYGMVILKIDVDIITQIDKYTHLRQTITSDGKCDGVILKSIDVAIGSFNSMLKTITARHISMKTRNGIIKSHVSSTLLYRCEAWTITIRNMAKL